MPEELTLCGHHQEEGDRLSPEARMELGRRVQRLRLRRGLERSELADRLGVSRQRVGNWERGVNTPALGILPALARELGVTIDELITGEPPPVTWLSPGEKKEAEQYLEGLRRLLG